MTQSNRTKEEFWNIRKQKQKPHGKVKSFEKLASDIDKNGANQN